MRLLRLLEPFDGIQHFDATGFDSLFHGFFDFKSDLSHRAEVTMVALGRLSYRDPEGEISSQSRFSAC